MVPIAQRGNHHNDRKYRDDQSDAADDDDDERSVHAHSLPENGQPVQVLNLPVARLAEPGVVIVQHAGNQFKRAAERRPSSASQTTATGPRQE